jgi:DNA-binding XRE family transcriptional regulator
VGRVIGLVFTERSSIWLFIGYNCLYMDVNNSKKPSRRSERRAAPPQVRRALRAVTEDLVVWRKLAGLTQVQLADRAGVSGSTLRRLEDADGGVSLENFLRILRALGALEGVSRALDPYETEVGRLRADEQLPQRVRPKDLTSDG